jgi:hypothetical protein
VFVAALIRDARSVLQRYHKHCIRAIVAPFWWHWYQFWCDLTRHMRCLE